MFDPDEPWNQEFVRLSIAGHDVDYAFPEITDYLREHWRTFEVFDRQAGKWERISEEMLATTRRPYLNSRISEAEGARLIELGRTADWTLVREEDRLVDADPTQPSGLYERAQSLYRHFADSAGRGISTGKIHKVLHAMRPHFFPILDSRLRTLYRDEARVTATELRKAGVDVSSKFAYWAAIRKDLVSNAEALVELRDQLREGDESPHQIAAEVLSDVRLMDMVSWRILA